MEKIYEQAKDLHVKSYVVYSGVATFGNKSFTLLYKDKERTTLVSVDEALDAFSKGILLVVGVWNINSSEDDSIARPNMAYPYRGEDGIIGWLFKCSSEATFVVPVSDDVLGDLPSGGK